MVYHITGYTYQEKLTTTPVSFLTRTALLDPDTLLEFEDYEKSLADAAEKYEQLGFMHTTLGPEWVHRQYYPDNYKPIPRTRFMISYQTEVQQHFNAALRLQGFQLSWALIDHMGQLDAMLLLIAEENVNLFDAMQWAKKIDTRSKELSDYDTPVVLPKKIQVKNNMIATEALIEHCLDNRIIDIIGEFGEAPYLGSVQKAIDRIHKVNNNCKF